MCALSESLFRLFNLFYFIIIIIIIIIVPAGISPARRNPEDAL